MKLYQKIIRKVSFIPLQLLIDAYKQGKPSEIIINNRTIVIEPEIPVSGMSLFGENGFVLGKEAFKSKEELIKTLLHEIYRLETSTIGKTGSATQEEVTQETKEALEFAERSVKYVLK